MISTDELREALQAYADKAPLPDAGSLIAGAERKRAHARNVRTAVIAGAAAVVMAVVTAVGIQGIGHEKALTPAQLNKKFHTHYAEYTHGLKLTAIVEVPIERAADPNSAPPAHDPANIELPKVGTAVYVVCDGSAIVGSDTGTESQLRSNGNIFGNCESGRDPRVSGAKPGERADLWVVTGGSPKASRAPIAIYTQVDWSNYPVKTTTLDPEAPSLGPTPAGHFDIRFAGSGATSVSKTVRVPVSALRGGSLMVAPSSTGRFQVLVDGTAQRLDYTGDQPADGGGSWGWVPPGFVPEVRGVWYDYWPDSGIGNVVGTGGNFAGPEPGTSATITMRAVGTTGPWQAMLAWQKK